MDQPRNPTSRQVRNAKSGWWLVRPSKDRGIIETGTGWLDELPVMASTVLRLEMLLQDGPIELQKVADLVLSDVGATLHTLRLAGREYEAAADRPVRLVDLISSLDVGKWFTTIASRTFGFGRADPTLEEIWRHCHLVAQYAQLVAESFPEIAPEDAYLVGLLHDIDLIPSALGCFEDGRDIFQGGAYLARELVLPSFILSAIEDTSHSQDASAWKFILLSAHKLLERSPDLVERLGAGFEL